MPIRTAGFLVIGVILLAAAGPLAAEVKLDIEQIPYSHTYESVQGLTAPTFVIGKDRSCQPLKKVLRLPITVATSGTTSGAISKTDGTKTVYFDKDSARLTPTTKSILDSLDTDMPVSVTGYTCPLGSAKHNRQLAEKRARAVAHYLRIRGVTLTTVLGKGGCCFVDGDFEKSRRVEIQPETSRKRGGLNEKG